MTDADCRYGKQITLINSSTSPFLTQFSFPLLALPYPYANSPAPLPRLTLLLLIHWWGKLCSSVSQQPEEQRGLCCGFSAGRTETGREAANKDTESRQWSADEAAAGEIEAASERNRAVTKTNQEAGTFIAKDITNQYSSALKFCFFRFLSFFAFPGEWCQFVLLHNCRKNFLSGFMFYFLKFSVLSTHIIAQLSLIAVLWQFTIVNLVRLEECSDFYLTNTATLF